MNLKRKITGVISVALICVFSVTIVCNAMLFTVSSVTQENTNWCWAACSEVVGRFNGGNVSQSTIVRYIFGSSTINSAATASQTAKAATYASDNVEWTNTGVLSETEAHERVNVKFQMYIIGMRSNTSNSGHMYVVHGLDGTQLRIYNTLNGRSQWVLY